MVRSLRHPLCKMGLWMGKGALKESRGATKQKALTGPGCVGELSSWTAIFSRSSHSATLPQACEFPRWQMESGIQDGRELDKKEKMLRSNRDKAQGPGPALASAGRRDYGYRQAEQHQTWLSWESMPFPPDQTIEEL